MTFILMPALPVQKEEFVLDHFSQEVSPKTDNVVSFGTDLL